MSQPVLPPPQSAGANIFCHVWWSGGRVLVWSVISMISVMRGAGADGKLLIITSPGMLSQL